jgi:hypothetical protein
MGRKTPRELELRRRKVPGEASPGEPDPFPRMRCRERNPRRGTVGRVSGRQGNGPVRTLEGSEGHGRTAAEI